MRITLAVGPMATAAEEAEVRALVALSGGVDSALAAALMVEGGHEVTGLTLLHRGVPPGSEPARPAPDEVGEARRLGVRLDIEHHVLDCSRVFDEQVVKPFVAAYRRGLTPNPCVECNRRVRFPLLLAEADRLGCDLVVTGHHARLSGDDRGYHLRRGADPGKDQSYFLFGLGQSEMSRLAFPVGEMGKEEVRRRARALGLPNADRRDSLDLCFVGPDGYRAFLRQQLPAAERPGPIVDPAGREVGRHEGVERFTIGQRRGLGVALGEARYVLEVDPPTATVVVGRAADLAAVGCRLGAVSWVAGEPPVGDGLEIKVRYRSPAVGARLEPGESGEWLVSFSEPVAAVAPGQAAVFYRGDEVMGGGTILAPVGRRRPGSPART